MSRWSWSAPALLVLIQVALFVWMSARGFDISDESFYFLHYLHWRELATSSFFGAVFGAPFQWMGQSIAGIRVLGLLLLLAGSGYLTFEAVCRFSGKGQGGYRQLPAAFWLAGMAGAMLYYGYLTTLRAPSYNLLALVSAMFATGFLLRLTSDNAVPIRWSSAFALTYGVMMALCALGKPPSAAILALIHALFVATLGGPWLRRHLAPLVFWAILGVGLVFGVLQLSHPTWLAAVRESLLMGATTDGRSLLNLARSLRWELQLLPLVFWPCAVAVGAVAVMLRRRKYSATLPAVAAVSLVLGCVVWISTGQTIGLWLPMVAMAALVLFSLSGGERSGWAVLLMLLAIPPALSFGTNMPVLGHSQINAAFAWAALLSALAAMHLAGKLGTVGLQLCLSALCLPGLVIQAQAALEARYTYRQPSALGEQDVPVVVGTAQSRLLVSHETMSSLKAINAAAQAAGWKPGQSLLDLTGDGPGWGFALGGRPLGVAWLLGGYSGSEAAVALLLGRLPKEALQQSWLLSSVNTSRRIEHWPEPLAARLGPDSHEVVATINVRTPYTWGTGPNPERVDLQLWRPKAAP